MGLLLEAMRSAVSDLLEQSVEWGRIEAANQERRTAMRTNKVRVFVCVGEFSQLPPNAWGCLFWCVCEG